MAEPSTVLAVLTTTGTAEEAEALAGGAVERRLAACAQVSAPVTSVYRWKGRIQQDREWQVLFKTTAARYAALETHLRQAHSYDEPEIIALPVTAGSPGYLHWVAEEVSDRPG